MANALYDSFKAALLSHSPSIDFDADTIKAVLVDLADYTFSAAHDFLDDVPGAARVATGTLANKTTTAGVFDADDLVLTAVTGDPSEAVILYKDAGGADSANPLIAFIDSAASGLPVTPNGGNITIAWDNGANKIFKIG